MARRPHGEVYFEPRHVGARARQPSKRIRASSYSPAHLTSRACCRSHDARDCVAKSSRGRARGRVFLMIGSYEAIIQTNLPFVTSTNHSTHYAVLPILIRPVTVLNWIRRKQARQPTIAHVADSRLTPPLPSRQQSYRCAAWSA